MLHPVRYIVAGFLAGALFIALTEMEELWENLTVSQKQKPERNGSLWGANKALYLMKGVN